MNFGQVTELEHAAWPVFRVDKSKRICGVNKAAFDFFGERLETLQLSGIWTAANDDAAWNQLWKQPAGPRKFKLIHKLNGEVEVTALVCPFKQDTHEQLVFQIVGSGEAAIPCPPPPQPQQAVEMNIAHKQKLDCALHLTRTVALDFNNALTTILGHASFILGQAEPSHKWRVSLTEIEKSAE